MIGKGGFESESGKNGPGPASGGAAARLDRLVAQARAAALWEQIWPLLWRGLGVVLLFLIVSWSGVWLDLPPLGRQLGLAVLAAVLVAALLPLIHVRRIAR
nr:DUF4175 domain-containing protein [Escherichia coli]